MRSICCVVMVAAFLNASRVGAGAPEESKSAFESDARGWTDLLPDAELKSWKRVSIPPGSKLNKKNCWSVDVSGKERILVCDGVGVHEMLLYEREFGDGILHIEWRFKKVEGKKGYNSGVYVRNSADGGLWHQAQVGSKNVGFLFGTSLVDGAKKGIPGKRLPGPQRGKEAGEWNTYEITCKGPDISLWINGAVTYHWPSCQVAKGHLGVEAEGYFIEFKNIMWKDLK